MEPLGASASIDLVGTLCRAEQLVFALLGDGAVRFASPVGSATAAAVADHAGWRARRWFELLPLVEPDRHLQPTEADRRMGAAARAQIVDVVTLLVVGRELVDRIARYVAVVAQRAVTPADAPLARLARITMVDLAADLAELDRAIALLGTAAVDPATGPANGPVNGPASGPPVDRAREPLSAIGWPGPEH